jgi:hypothetical protein
MSSVFWNMPGEGQLTFQFILHLQVQEVSQARNEREAFSKQSFKPFSCFGYSPTLKMEAV